MQLRALAAAAWLLAGCASSPKLPTELDRAETFEFALPNLDGQRVEARSLRGNVVLVDVWATWCAPCERSFPAYAELAKKHADQGLRVVAVSVDERLEDVRAWLKGKQLPFTVLHDPEGTVPESMGLRTMPSAVVLDRQGRVVGAHAGYREGDEAHIEGLILEALSRGAAP